MIEPEDSSVLWLVIVGFIIAFVLAFGIGANDVANSFGTSVGAKVLTLFQACVIASIFELAGAILVGSKVSDTVRKGIIDINRFNGTEELAMAGAFSALTGTSVWLIVATFFNLPVSGTHSIVGATIGYGLVALGGDGIMWVTFGKIAASWVISPLLSGIVSSSIFFGIDRLVLRGVSPLRNGLIALPILSGATIFINLFSIFYSSAEVFGMGEFEWYVILGICVGCSVFVGLVIQFAVNPWLKKKILSNNTSNYTADFTAISTESTVDIMTRKNTNDDIKDVSTQLLADDDCIKGAVHSEAIEVHDPINGHTVQNCDLPKEVLDTDLKLTVDEEKKSFASNIADDKADVVTKDTKPRSISIRSRSRTLLREVIQPVDENARSKIQDDPHSAQLFKYLQILTAAFGAFAHGGNDVSNAIGPLISLWLIYKNGLVVSKSATPIWILIYGGVGIIVGLCVWGRRVIKTIGENLSPITPSSGFSIEIGSALTVLLASNLGIPVSTTHCKVGSVVIVGRLRSKEVVNWSLFGNIMVSWIITMPITGAISAVVFAIIREVL